MYPNKELKVTINKQEATIKYNGVVYVIPIEEYNQIKGLTKDLIQYLNERYIFHETF